MKSKPKVAAALLLALVALAPGASYAQKQKQDAAGRKPQAGERLEPDDQREVRADVPEEALANRRERVGEAEAEEIPSYNNFLTSYRLGPEDVISVTVFDLPKYSKTGIIVPPAGVIG